MWLVIVRQCNSCGGDFTVKLSEKEPTDENMEEIEREAGYSTCQTVVKSEIEMNEIIDIEAPN